MLAPLLYMLALAGIGAAVLYSSYSQILRSNAQITAINAVRAQLQSAGTTLAAASVLDAPTSTIVQPPAVYAFGSIAGGDTAKLPGNYTNASTTGSPHDVGVIDTSTGVRQLDPWGKFYVYCRWENAVSSPASPSIMVISAGPDGNLDTKCGDTVAQGDDKIITSTVAETINRANVWQVNSSSQIKYGLAANPVQVNANGSMTADMLTLGTATAASTSGQLSAVSANISGALTAGSTTFSGATITGNATIGGTLGVTGATTLTGALTANGGATTTTLTTSGLATLSSATVSGNATVGGAFGVTGNTTLSGTLSAGASGLGNTAVTGTFSASGAVTMSSTLSAGATSLSSLTLTTPLAIAQGGTGSTTAAGARTALGLGTMATQNANAVAITGGTITGVDLTGSTGGTAGSVAAGNVTGCCVAISAGGTGAADAATARSNLGTNDAGNLTTGTLNALRLPTSGVVAGTYTQVTVDAYGRVTIGANVNSSQWTNSGSNIYFNTGDVSIGTSVANTELNVYNASSATLTDFTQALTKGAINVLTNYTANNYTPGVFWSATDDNATKPKAGIWLKEAAAGATMYLGTSNAYATGITNQALSISPSGAVTASGGFVGNLTGNVTGNITGSISMVDGTAASPGLFFTNETNTGLYRPSAGVLGIAALGNDAARFTGNASAVNYINFGAATTGNPLTITAAGTDTNMSINVVGKGTGGVNLLSNGNTAFAASNSSGSEVNFLSITGAVTGSAVNISAAGSDTDIGINLNPKGAGSVTTAAPFAVNGSMTTAVSGTTSSTSGTAIYGSAGAGTGTTYAGYFTDSSTSGTSLFAIAGNAATKGLVVKAAASQTGNLAEFQNSSATVLAKVDASGYIAEQASGYINFGLTTGSSGYGVRDNSGTIEFKNSGGGCAVGAVT